MALSFPHQWDYNWKIPTLNGLKNRGQVKRQCRAIVVDVSINSQRVARELTRLIDLYGRPEFIVCDKGTEYTSLVLFDWAQRSGVGLQFIQLGKPSQNDNDGFSANVIE